MPNPVTSFRIDDDTREWLMRYDTPQTEQIRQDLLALRALVLDAERRLNERFTVQEGMLLCDLMNSTWLEPSQAGNLAHQLAVEADDGCRLDGLDEKWGVDRDSLVAKLSALTPLEAYTVWHWTRLFWVSPERNEDTKAFVRRLFRAA